MRVAFTGSRDAKNTPQVYRIIALIEADLKGIDHVIVGDARGIDTMCFNYFKGKTRVTMEYAQWTALGNSAGHVRNGHMLDHKPDFLVAFPGGVGTKNCVGQAIDRDITVFHVTEFMLNNSTLVESNEKT